MTAVHVVVPAGIDEPARVSGGNRYDRRMCDGLRAAGWQVTELAAPGGWPRPAPDALSSLAGTLDALPDGALLVVDGLIASASAVVLAPRSDRLRLVVLVHMTFGGMAFGDMAFGGDTVPAADEFTVLAAARAVVTTSAWTRRHLLERYGLPPARVHVVTPGTDPAPVSVGTADGGRLLCVGTLSPLKGQDLLLEALARTAALPWRCTFVGPPDRDPPFAAALERRAAATGIAGRLRWAGVLTGALLDREYREADLLVVPSRSEAYGMVVTEALAAGVPVLAAAVGGIPEALGRTPSGVPGCLVPPDDAGALAATLERWLTDADLRDRLRRAALRRREGLPGWRATDRRLRSVLAAVRSEPDAPPHRVPR